MARERTRVFFNLVAKQTLLIERESEMESFDISKDGLRADAGSATTTRPYETPSIRVMDEKDVLSSFQVTVAGITWWVM